MMSRIILDDDLFIPYAVTRAFSITLNRTTRYNDTKILPQPTVNFEQPILFRLNL